MKRKLNKNKKHGNKNRLPIYQRKITNGNGTDFYVVESHPITNETSANDLAQKVFERVNEFEKALNSASTNREVGPKMQQKQEGINQSKPRSP